MSRQLDKFDRKKGARLNSVSPNVRLQGPDLVKVQIEAGNITMKHQSDDQVDHRRRRLVALIDVRTSDGCVVARMGKGTQREHHCVKNFVANASEVSAMQVQDAQEGTKGEAEGAI